MALIVEDGTGKDDAEAFASVSAADTYHAARGNTAWAAIGSDPTAVARKERNLRLATEYLIDQFEGRWKGERFTDTQALPWPRANVYLPDLSSPIAETPLPWALVRATIELALITQTADLYVADDAVPVAVEEKTVVGPIERVRKYKDSGTATGKPIDRVTAMIAVLLDAPSYALRVGRG